MPYDTAKELQPLINLAVSPNILVTHPSVQAKNIAELLALAKAKPGEIAYASGGTGAFALD
jgi:tripartite-type tricarboxylate transporter receptor subunit TctC